VAQTFNGDSDIKILLVTKAIGGEGLNLSSANCVIMFDHDYNPTVDMQAIDRAHRIGQKRVLNVYRLITKDTLEEKIMGIQKFKINLADAIVNIDNASIKNIKESKLPELLENVRDIVKNKDSEAKINSHMFGSIVAEMEKNAIEPE
jgi:TATA-binding protein-associated factor